VMLAALAGASFSPYAPAAAACDEIGNTCVFGPPPDDESMDCDAHLMARHVEAWVNCQVNLFKVPGFPVSESAPTIGEGTYIRVNVTIQRTDNDNTSVGWGFRFDETATGASFDGDDLHQGVLAPGDSYDFFTFDVGADGSDLSYIVIPIAFWGDEHAVQYDWLGFNVDHGGVEPTALTRWIAITALVISVGAAILALISWSRTKPRIP
jgi:hypothetical protein